MKALKGAYPLRPLSRVLGVPRSTLYYRPQDPLPRRRPSGNACGPWRRPGPGTATGASPPSCGGKVSRWGRSGSAP
ncbi:hypothetical protein TthHB5018_b22440 (plasmid) [Thermus thermophilus]|uniref:Uncharacterized protein n=1 Tax=Thermus thermophilus TaxID=274 RepID=A0A7R7TG46_THETH|nr:hypothetical protein TthHB5018_b22440 [Thermus thermophilus]